MVLCLRGHSFHTCTALTGERSLPSCTCCNTFSMRQTPTCAWILHEHLLTILLCACTCSAAPSRQQRPAPHRLHLWCWTRQPSN